MNYTVNLKLHKDDVNGEWGFTHHNTVGTFNAFWGADGIFHDVFEHFFEYNHKYFMGDNAFTLGFFKLYTMNLDILKSYEEKGLLYSQIHPNLPLTIWNYTDKVQWENCWDDITFSCRGLVTDDLGNIVARPFKKFFNLSENKTKITSEFEIFTKYDGSLGILFYYKTQWVFASRGSFTSDQAIKGFELLQKYDYNSLNKNNTYCFEIIYKENKIVVDYDYEDVILTGVFNTLTGKEQQIDIYGLTYAESHNINTPLQEIFNHIKDTEEGYVIKFSNGERCKIKGEEYIRIHKLISEISSIVVWECLKNNQNLSEILKDIPDEFYKSIKEYETYLKTLFNFAKSIVELEYLTLPKIRLDKDFALFIKDNKYKSYLFMLRKNKDITQQIWKNIKPEYKRL